MAEELKRTRKREIIRQDKIGLEETLRMQGGGGRLDCEVSRFLAGER